VAVNAPAGLRVTSARVAGFAVAVTAAGKVWAWGRGMQGDLGNGANSGRLRPVRVRVPAGVRVMAVRVGFDFAVAVTATGRVLTWGDGRAGELGNGRRKSSNVPVFANLPRGVRVTAVSAGAESVLALTSTGRVLAWGDNQAGELGNGRVRNSGKPVWVRLPRRTTITAIGAGVSHMFAVTSTGALLTWGDNAFGELGIGKKGEQRKPVRVHLPSGVKVVAAFGGLGHSLALTASGRVLAWGDNEAGQLGIGTVKSSNVPVYAHIPKADKIVALAAGREHSLALTRSGKVLAWGDDSAGQLGDGMIGFRKTPFQISVPGRVISIGAGCEGASSVAVVTKIID
jgi:alpha-tubulin suppressor-like RCC1 family protein